MAARPDRWQPESRRRVPPARRSSKTPACPDYDTVIITVSTTSRLTISGLEQHLDGTSAPGVLQCQDGLVPALEREAVRDDRRQVHSARHEIEVVLHGMLGHAAHLLDPEAVRADDAQLLEVQRRPLEPLWWLDAGDDKRAAGRQQAQRRLHGLGRADRVVDDGRAVLQPIVLAPRRERRGTHPARDLRDE